MFYKIEFKTPLTLPQFTEAFEIFESALLSKKISIWNSQKETVDLAEEGQVALPKFPISSTVGGFEIPMGNSDLDKFFKLFKKIIVDSLNKTEFKVKEVYINDSNVVNDFSSWSQIPSK